MSSASFAFRDPGPSERLRAVSAQLRTPRFYVPLATVLVFPLALTSAPNLLMPSDWSFVPYALVMGIGGFALLLALVYLRALVARVPASTVTFDDDGIHEERKGQRSHREWRWLADVLVDGDRITLVLGASESFRVAAGPPRVLVIARDDLRLPPLADLIARHTRFRI